MSASGRLVLEADPRLEAAVRALAGRRMVFLAGLPGTGKSLLVHQLAHAAVAARRAVHLLQWDVARPVFEAAPEGRRYPLADGVTHPLIRKAAGLWARRAVADWHDRHPDPRHLLLGETPFVGNRFVELARPASDPAEALLAAPSCRFVIAVPSVEVRAFLEAERERRAASPLHPREREDAPPHVLRALWREVAEVARSMGLAGADAAGVERTDSQQPAGAVSGAASGGRRGDDTVLADRRGGSVASDPPTTATGGEPSGDRADHGLGSYDPAVYRRVYAAVLRHRHVDVIPLDTILPTAGMSVYEFAAAPVDMVPTSDEAAACIREIERRHPDARALARDVARWWTE